MGTMMNSEDPDIVYFYGDNVTMKCNLGAAFAVDYSKSMPDRAVNTSVLLCDDDLMSPEGVWTNTANCTGMFYAF